MKKAELLSFINENENVYQGKHHEIKYLYIPAKNSEHLTVILSGFHGKEVTGKPPVYNYINSLKDIEINKLFILDGVDNIPVYYYGQNSKPTYMNDVSDLIKSIAKEAKINMRRVIIGGSSKGGTGSLLIGLNLSVGHIISGANQLYVGTYLSRMGPKLRNLMLPKILGENSGNSAEKLDNIFKKHLLIDKTRSNLYFHGGTRDSHYIGHMKPLLAYYDSKGIMYELDLKNYVGHNSVIYYFPEYLRRKINEILNLPVIKTPNITEKNNGINVSIDVSFNRVKTFEFRVYLYMKNGDVLQTKYKKSLEHFFEVDLNQVKTVKVFLKEYEMLRDVRIFSLRNIIGE